PAQAPMHAPPLPATSTDPHPEEAAHDCVRPSRRMAAHPLLAHSCLRPSFETHCGRQAANRNAPQRLSWLSSVLPFFVVSEHGVERGEKFASNCDEGEHFGFAGGEQTSVEGLEGRIVAAGNESSHVECPACGTAAAGDHALAFPAPGLTGEGSQPREACDLAARESAELWQFCQDRPRQDVADGWNGLQQIFLFTPGGRAADQSADVAIDLRQLLLEHSDMTRDTLTDARIGHPLLALAFGHDHFDDLPAPADQF